MTKKKPSDKKKKMGRPTQYNPSKHPTLAQELAEQGMTNPQIAEALHITEATLWSWGKKYPDFLSAIKAGKDETDKAVVKTLLQRAMGYKITEKKVIQLGDEQVKEDEGGKKFIIKSVRREITEKEVVPDVTAQIFWLKNRQPKDWRDKQVQEITGKDGAPLIPLPEMTDTEVMERARSIIAGK